MQAAPQPAARPVFRQPQAPAQPAPAANAPAASKPAGESKAASSGGWKIAIQFIVGLLVIGAVAATIVWLYLKYYTQ
jgi:hypothetical protein